MITAITFVAAIIIVVGCIMAGSTFILRLDQPINSWASILIASVTGVVGWFLLSLMTMVTDAWRR